VTSAGKRLRVELSAYLLGVRRGRGSRMLSSRLTPTRRFAILRPQHTLYVSFPSSGESGHP
jgi:hypothetical protein